MESSSSRRPSASAAAHRRVLVYDFRSNQKMPPRWLDTLGLDFSGFSRILQKTFTISSNERFDLATTDRVLVDAEKFNQLKDESTLYLLRHKEQELPFSTEESINFTPHHHTLTEGGLYEYHSSKGNSSLSVALAELIDNSLSATARNGGERTIDIRLMLDATQGKPAVIITDNGCGMTSKKLNNWAVYKLSKFTREESVFSSLNSDISFFGVGGKHAIFFIGDSVRMITKPASYPDVHELVLSREGLQKKEANKEDVFKGTIKNRKPGDSSHLEPNHERFLQDVIAAEHGKRSFTTVVITGVQPDFVNFIKKDFGMLTRELAHIYHYYIHGANGNDLMAASTSSTQHDKINIWVTLQERSSQRPRVRNLRDVGDDMQTLYIRSAVDTFEFQASTVKGDAKVEGLIRYHPFLYYKETYPQDPHAEQASSSDEDDPGHGRGILNRARGKKPIFECFWNGRLVPSTTVADFDWCSFTKGSTVPAECYNRLSGVLFSDDGFKVTQSKLSFMDLELKLKDKKTIFTTVQKGQKTAKRGNIEKEFMQWLWKCHEQHDKQVKFMGYKETIERKDGNKKEMQVWTTFSSIEWDGKIFRAGQLVKSCRTQPILYGTVDLFMLRGNHKKDVYATGGQVKIIREPKALYDIAKEIPISKIDRSATDDAIRRNIESDTLKLPKQLLVTWPENNQWPQNAVCVAGTPIGPLKVEILNGKEEAMSSIPCGDQRGKLSMRMCITEDGPQKKKITSLTAPHLTTGGFWFKKNACLTKLGKYTLTLNAVVNENCISFAGRQLPSQALKFTITAGTAHGFVFTEVQSNVHVGVPFHLPLEIRDRFDHPTALPLTVNPELACSGLQLSEKEVTRSGCKITIKVTATGKIPKNKRSESYELTVTLPGLSKDTQTLKIELLPGAPKSLCVTPQEEPIQVENGNTVEFHVQVHDEAGNVTTNAKQAVRCRVPGFPVQAVDCSGTGVGQLLTKPISVQIIEGEPKELRVVFEMPNQKDVTAVSRVLTVLPSTRVSRMELSCHNDDGTLVFKSDEKIEWPAGGLLENLFYKLYDEAGRDVALTPEIASKIKVNWTGELNKQDLLQGKLPDVQVPEHVHEKRFCQVSYQDHSVSASFCITPRPDEAAQLKVTPSETSAQLGETLAEDINLELVDQYGNVTGILTPPCVRDMSAEADGLDQAAVTFTWKESNSCVVVTGVRFQDVALGPRKIWFMYGSYKQCVIVNVTAGVPAELVLVNRPAELLQFLNAKSRPTQFDVQLYDKWGNSSDDQRVVVELKSSPPGLKVSASVSSQPVSSEGKASFIVTSVSGPKGYYQLTFQASFNHKPIPSPSVNFTVIPDPNKPVRLSVEYNKAAICLAGGVFPVTVVSDEGSPMMTFSPAAVTMLLWEGGHSGDQPPADATVMTCSRPLGSDRKGCFYFRDKPVPEHVGRCSIQFSLKTDPNEFLFSDQIPMNVVANQPVKLGPEFEPPSPIVSCNDDIDHRTLVKDITLRIMDSFGNPAGRDLNGNLVVSITGVAGKTPPDLPLFEAKSSTVQFDLVAGETRIARLAIMKKSPGQNGGMYNLVFRPDVSMAPAPLAPFRLPFHFYNSADNQKQMSELTRRKSELIVKVDALKSMFSTTTELLELLTSQLLEANQKTDNLRNELYQKQITIPSSASVSTIDELIRQKNAEVERICHARRRVCNIPDPFEGSQDVLGKVGHLAVLQDDDAARVISWCLGGVLDCVVTRTTEAALRIHRDTQGAQQLVALDSMFIPQNRPLPHIQRGRQLFDPPGNPVMARELLIYPRHPESSEKVFKNFLGDTILMDDIVSATEYRKKVVQHKLQCPTILTRDGNRVNAKGTFGGAQNKAPPMERMKVLGAPFPESYRKLEQEKELLVQYRAAAAKREEVEDERNEHLMTIRTAEHRRKQEEMKHMEQELNEIETRLETMQARSARRSLQDVAESSGIPAKRTRK